MRTEELLNYLSKLNLPKIVSLSEDATRIFGRVQYNAKTNEIVGFVLSIDNNGMPITGSYPARTAAEIEGYFYDVNTGKEKQPANYINVIMAQTLTRGIPPFCLMLYCTDNKYTSLDVGKRWSYISNVLERNGIKVISIGSDSDPKFNSVMRHNLQFGQTRNIDCVPVPEWFGARFGTNMKYYPIQDTIHIGTKFRNKMLNQSMKFGTHVVSVDHLCALLKRATKEKHRLTEAIIKPKDRQNFDSVLRISNKRVIDLLGSQVEGSQGTVLYLRIIDNVLRSYLDLKLTALERIRAIWFGNFLLRIWRSDVMKRRGSLERSFITNNCYSCVEINAHSLILIILYLKEQGLDHTFCPELLGSQPCEGTFRQIRSISTSFSTVTNSSLMEIMSKMSKIELQNLIAFIHLRQYKFPRIETQSSSYYSQVNRNGENCYGIFTKLPSWDAIVNEIELAKLQAIEYAESLGISIQAESTISIKNKEQISYHVHDTRTRESTNELNVPIMNLNGIHEQEDTDQLRLFSDINLKEYENKKFNPETLTERSLYIKIRNVLNEIFYVSKHTIVWLLSKSQSKLSSDRLRRVMDKRD